MLRRLTSSYALITVLVSGAVALTLHGTALAQQGPQLVSASVKELPMEPGSAVWRQATAVDVPLTPQLVALPRLMQTSVSSLSVRSLNDGKQVAFLLEWADGTRDARATRPDEFRDAAALLFSVGDSQPFVCMGTPGQLTNLWHWKADWQEDIDKGFQEVVDAYPNFFKDSYPFVVGEPPFRAPADFGSAEAQQYFIALVAGNPLAQPDRSSPVEDLVAEGFGTATHKTEQNVQGRGVWSNGRWQVVFSRSLEATDPSAAKLAGGADVPVAFAVWNGSNQEVGARKQLSSLLTVRVAGGAAAAVPAPAAPGTDQDMRPLVAGSIVVLACSVALVGMMRGRREEASEREAAPGQGGRT